MSFGTGAGKGSLPRKVDLSVYAKNYNDIFSKEVKETESEALKRYDVGRATTASLSKELEYVKGVNDDLRRRLEVARDALLNVRETSSSTRIRRLAGDAIIKSF